MSEEITYNQVVVWVGWIDQGLDFFGPFNDPDSAQKYITEKVSKDLPCGWAFMDSPEPDEEAFGTCGMCGADELCDCQVTIPDVKLTVLKKVPEQIVGTQTAIPGTVPEIELPKGPELQTA